MDSTDRAAENSSPRGWRQLLPVGLIIATVAVAGGLLSPGGRSDSAAILDISTGVSPSPDEEPAGAPEPSDAAPEPSEDPSETGAVAPPHRDPLEVPDDTSSAPDRASTADLAPGEWSAMAAPPFRPRWGAVVAWTGSEAITWGGMGAEEGAQRQRFHGEGAAYSAAEDSWRLIAASPLESRVAAASAWTGAELLVWGGSGSSEHFADGAAYDPQLDQWRPMAASPLAPRSAAAAVWTGGELLVIGGHDNAGPLGDAAAYDPRRDAWRLLSPGPAALARIWEVSAVWAGDSVVVWPRDGAAEPGARYVLDSDRWEPFPPLGAGADTIRQVLWTGDEIIGAMAGRNSDRMKLVRMGLGDEWEEEDTPWGLGAWGSVALWSDAGVLILTTGPRHWLYRPDSDTWSRLPDTQPLDLSDRSTVWTGAELLVWENSAEPTASWTGTVFRFAEDTAGQG